MIRYAFMTCILHVFHMFDEMFVSFYVTYDYEKFEAVLGSGLETDLELWLRSWDHNL